MSIERLDASLRAAGIPASGVSVKVIPPPTPEYVRVDFLPEATDEDRRRADDIVAAFDWSDETQAERENQHARLVASGTLDDSDPSGKLSRGIIDVLLAEINALRVELLPTAKQPLTFPEACERIKAVINSGAVDHAPETPRNG